MSKSPRAECIEFARFNGIQIKGKHTKASKFQPAFFDVTAFCPSTNWVYCFESWSEAHTFFLAAVNAHRDNLAPYPWS